MSEKPQPESKPASPAIDDCWNKIGVWGEASCDKLESQVHCRNCPTYSAAALQLLDRDLPGGYLSDWAVHFAKEQQTEELDTHSVIIFRIATEWLALPTSICHAVSDLRSIHSLPHRKGGTVLGLANFRGELLVCVSLGEVLGLEKAATVEKDKQRTVHERLLVLSREGSRLVFPVDEIHGIYRYHPREMKEVPATVAKATATYTRGMLPWQSKAVGILDDQLLFYTLNRSLA